MEAYVRRHRTHLSLNRLLESAVSIAEARTSGDDDNHDDDILKTMDSTSRQEGNSVQLVSSAAVQSSASKPNNADTTNINNNNRSNCRKSVHASLTPSGFFVKLRRWLTMMRGTRTHDRGKNLLERLEKTYAVSRVIYDKFFHLFNEIFRNDDDDIAFDVDDNDARDNDVTNQSGLGSDEAFHSGATKKNESAAEVIVPPLRRETRTYGKRGRLETDDSVSVTVSVTLRCSVFQICILSFNRYFLANVLNSAVSGSILLILLELIWYIFTEVIKI